MSAATEALERLPHALLNDVLACWQQYFLVCFGSFLGEGGVFDGLSPGEAASAGVLQRSNLLSSLLSAASARRVLQ